MPQELYTVLLSHRDEGYHAFQTALMPTVDPTRVIGVRVPLLRRLAKSLSQEEKERLLHAPLPHDTYEEDAIHAFLIESIRNYGACIEALDAFLPFVDNWAVCDSMNPRVLGLHKKDLLADVERWMNATHTYTVRFAIKLLMTHFLDADFDPAYPSRIAKIQSEEYYVNMMIAWYFATALAKQESTILPYLEEHRLSPWIHKKTIRKAIESYRIPEELKKHLRTLS